MWGINLKTKGKRAQMTQQSMTDIQKSVRTFFRLGKTFEIVSDWDNAFKHYSRAAQLHPCFDTLIKAQLSAHEIGNHIDALYFAMQTKKAAIAEYGEDSLQHAESLHALGSIYQRNKQDKEAESLYQQAIKIYRSALGGKHPVIAICHANLSTIYFFRTHYGKAETSIMKALKIQEKAFQKNHPDIADTLAILGMVYTKRKKYNEAERSLEKSLEIYKNNSMEKYERSIATYKGFAELYEKQERYKEAERYCKKIILTSKKHFGKEHRITADGRYRLGQIYTRQRLYKKARFFSGAALNVLEPLLGKDHPDIVYMRFFHDRLENVLAINSDPSQ